MDLFPRLIASIDWAKQEEGLRLLRDALPTRIQHPRKFDLLVIDEAHNVAPTVSSYTDELANKTCANDRTTLPAQTISYSNTA